MMQATAHAGTAPRKRGADPIRDTIDSIIVAFILAFVFRAFIVEAFIIPTGSMGPTLRGSHGQLRCDSCACSFPYNRRPEQDVLSNDFSVVCPNCDRENHVDANSAKPSLANTGDRILVLKWPYDLGGPLLGPHRWDVVVFKAPIKQPPEPDGKTNYIKRLTGLPNEVLEIIDGDLYAAPAAALKPDLLEKLDPRGRQQLTASDRAALDSALVIQRKTPVAQRALWMSHYDHDFVPRDDLRTPSTPAWSLEPVNGAGQWDARLPRITFAGGSAEQFITLSGKPLRDQYGYNSMNNSRALGGADMAYQGSYFPVGDARLELVLEPGEVSPGRLTLSISKDGMVFVVFIADTGDVELSRISPGRPGYRQPLKSARVDPLRSRHPVSLALENVDFRVAFEVNGQRVIETSDTDYSPNPGQMRDAERQTAGDPTARVQLRIGAVGMPMALMHVRVLRDVYYRPVDNGSMAAAGPVGRAWGTRGSPIWLREGEYFVCGDNSPQSADSRLWKPMDSNDLVKSMPEYQVGTVPADQMIGRAFFVYWPSGKRVKEDSGPPIIPQVGRMRFIR